jgi:threonine dehydratase
MPEKISLADIQTARQRIAPCVRRTPLTPSTTLSERLKTNV